MGARLKRIHRKKHESRFFVNRLTLEYLEHMACSRNVLGFKNLQKSDMQTNMIEL